MISVKGQNINHILFDLDDTLYPKTAGLMAAVSERINQYMETRLGISPPEVKVMRQKYYQTYGTTSRGLYLDYGISLDDYLIYVHDLPVESYIKPNNELEQMLGRLSCEKSIFTNSPDYHVRRVLAALGVEKHISYIFDIFALGRIHKPDRRVYERVLHTLASEAEECLLVDDLVRNLLPGKELGMITVLVGDVHGPGSGINFALSSVLDLERVVDS